MTSATPPSPVGLLRVHARETGDGEPTAILTLPFGLRQKSRLRARLDDGREVGVVLPRGGILRGGDRLCAEDGTVIEVKAAPERVSRVTAQAGQSLARAAYHLGNRHVALELGHGFVQYLHDHVLDEMVRGLGFRVDVLDSPFEPEAGAYGGGHTHGHSHD